MITLEDWYQWKACCAVVRCDDKPRAHLTEYLNRRTRRLLQKWARNPGTLDPKNGVTLFDSWMSLGKKPEEKRPKDWMMEALLDVRDPLREANIMAGYKLRDAVKAYLWDEKLRIDRVKHLITTSLDEQSPQTELPVRDRLLNKSSEFLGEGDGDEALPGTSPATELDEKEFREIAMDFSAAFLAGLSDKEKKALLAITLELEFNHPVVLAVLGVRHSAAGERRSGLVRRLAKEIREKYPEDESDAHYILASMVLEELKTAILRDPPLALWTEQLFQVAGAL